MRLISPLIFVTEILDGARLPSPPLWLDLLSNVAVLGFAGVPVAIGFAVLKYRLYDIDVVINRALVYGSLTAVLITLYFGGVAMTQAIFRALTDQEQQPQLAVVVSTLVMAVLFNPLRRRIQSFIDRRFYRRKYDARKTLEEFSARLREQTDLKTLNKDLAGVIEETLQSPPTSRCGCVPTGARSKSRRTGSVLRDRAPGKLLLRGRYRRCTPGRSLQQCRMAHASQESFQRAEWTEDRMGYLDHR